MTESFGGLDLKKISQNELDILISEHNLFEETIGEQGKKLILDEVDFRGLDLSQLDFGEVYIMSSLFENTVFSDKNFSRAQFYSCCFNHVTFNNIRFGKSVFDYTQINNCVFDNSIFIRVDTYQTEFKNVDFKECQFVYLLALSYLDHIEFINCEFADREFYEVKINELNFISDTDLDLEKLVYSINIGDFENEHIITGEEAIEYFKKHSTFAKL